MPNEEGAENYLEHDRILARVRAAREYRILCRILGTISVYRSSYQGGSCANRTNNP